jgi:uncharacterized protein
VLAPRAAQADAAATMLGNAVDLPGHPSVQRQAASALRPDSDLGELPVVSHVGPLHPDEVARGLDAGAGLARQMQHQQMISAAALFLRGQSRIVAQNPSLITEREAADA